MDLKWSCFIYFGKFKLALHALQHVQHKNMCSSRPTERLEMQTSTPYAHTRSEESSNLVLKVTECSHFNSSACGFVGRSAELLKCEHSVTFSTRLELSSLLVWA